MTYGTFAGSSSSSMAAQKESKVFTTSTGVVDGGAYEDGHKGDGGAGSSY